MSKTASIHSIFRTPYFILSLKIGFVMLLGWMLYVQVFVNYNTADLYSEFNRSILKNGGGLIPLVVILLMPINWMLESQKWKLLVNQFQPFSKCKSVRSILSGVSLAIMTPGRIGEYGGRLVGIDSDNRSKAVLANLISSLSQNIVNIGVGMVLAILFLHQFMEIQQEVFLSLVFISTVVICMLLLAYFRLDLLGGLLAYLPDHRWIDKIRESTKTFSDLSNGVLFSILSISALRYVVYVGQYVLLIYFFGVTDQVWAAVLGVGTLFFLQSNLPLPPVLSVLARGEMAIFLWSVFTSNVIGIIAATFSLWIINLVIPAILGAVVISGSKNVSN